MTQTDTAWCSGQSVRAREPRWDAIGTPLWYRTVWCRCGRVGDGREMVACVIEPASGVGVVLYGGWWMVWVRAAEGFMALWRVGCFFNGKNKSHDLDLASWFHVRQAVRP